MLNLLVGSNGFKNYIADPTHKSYIRAPSKLVPLGNELVVQ
jgi:hypothetical protein